MLRGLHANATALRIAYFKWTDRSWPHNDDYLRELTREAATKEQMLNLMRECDFNVTPDMESAEPIPQEKR